jgi:hypothetical protein
MLGFSMQEGNGTTRVRGIVPQLVVLVYNPIKLEADCESVLMLYKPITDAAPHAAWKPLARV